MARLGSDLSSDDMLMRTLELRRYSIYRSPLSAAHQLHCSFMRSWVAKQTLCVMCESELYCLLTHHLGTFAPPWTTLLIAADRYLGHTMKLEGFHLKLQQGLTFGCAALKPMLFSALFQASPAILLIMSLSCGLYIERT